MDMTLLLGIIVTVIALLFNFTNGFHDSANVVATVIASRSVEPEIAMILAAAAEFIGAYFLGTAVAETIGKGIVDPTLLQAGNIGAIVIIAALIGAISWNLLTWYFGIPASSSHALIGGLIGAFFFGWGPKPINWVNVWRIILVMLMSPFIGLIITYIFTKFTLFCCQWATPKANGVFKKLQIVTLVTQAMAHGTNDGQKTMGVITFALIILGLYHSEGKSMSVPHWVVISSALTMSVGMGIGGWKIIKTLGTKLYKIRPIHSFASQMASTLIIYLTSVMGFPISTTQVISSSVMGAGAAFRPKMIRWGVAQDMAVAWLITIPASGLIAGIMFFILKKLFVR